jgi:hypothetical protein
VKAVILTTVCFLLCGICAEAKDAPTKIARSLALDLADENLHSLSALEFRRYALTAEEDTAKSGFLAGAAWEYLQADQLDLAMKMLDQSENTSRSSSVPALLLRGEIELDRRKYKESEFFFSTLQQSKDKPDFKRFASSRLALLAVKNDDLVAAQGHLESASSQTALKELELFRASSRRSARVGGLLGMIPGLGYAYSGEYANGLRSVILNGIFIYAMVETGDRDQWGAFTALSFFELTWYTGSIYGGIDSAHRFNQRREDAATAAIEAEYDYRMNLKSLPIINLEFNF